jgi:hypothetical protein
MGALEEVDVGARFVASEQVLERADIAVGISRHERLIRDLFGSSRIGHTERDLAT